MKLRDEPIKGLRVPELETLLGEIAAEAHLLALMCSGGPPLGRAIWERVSEPQPGDLVYEASTIQMRPMPSNNIGRLVSKRYQGDGVIIERLRGGNMTWNNCMFWGIPTRKIREDAQRSLRVVDGD